VERICISVSHDPMVMHPQFREAILDVFCRYYVSCEPENCFVAVDAADAPVGYILCAENFVRYEKRLAEEILHTIQNPVTKAMAEGSKEAMRSFAPTYPAHLHIDLLPACRGHGTGRRLVEHLCEHLASKGVPGVMLNVANDNTGAKHFYEKCGFVVLKIGEQETVYGKILTCEEGL